MFVLFILFGGLTTLVAAVSAPFFTKAAEVKAANCGPVPVGEVWEGHVYDYLRCVDDLGWVPLGGVFLGGIALLITVVVIASFDEGERAGKALAFVAILAGAFLWGGYG